LIRLEARQRLTIANSSFSGNVAISDGLSEGGAINAALTGAVEGSGSSFIRNKAISVGGGVANGGALYIRGNREPGSLSDSTLAAQADRRDRRSARHRHGGQSPQCAGCEGVPQGEVRRHLHPHRWRPGDDSRHRDTGAPAVALRRGPVAPLEPWRRGIR
jgi:hypothetical protein